MHTLKLTSKQARFLWGIVDGACDAGACKGGLTPDEQRMGHAISMKLNDMVLADRKAAQTKER